MEQGEIKQLAVDMEKAIPAGHIAYIDMPKEHAEDVIFRKDKAILIGRDEIAEKLDKHVKGMFLISRSGREIICSILNMVIEKKLAPKYIVIIKKWSVLDDILQEYRKSLREYEVYQQREDKSVCILIHKAHTAAFQRSQLMEQYDFKQIIQAGKIPVKVNLRHFKRKLSHFIMSRRRLRDLYSVWRENPGFFRFCRAIFRIIKERFKKAETIALPQGGDSGLELCIYDTDRERIVQPGDKIRCNTVTVVVCVYNALDDVKELLTSLWNNRSFPYDILLIDDGSQQPTKEYLEYYAGLTQCKLIRHEQSWGYTKSANDGLRHAEGDYVVLLNSDTIVTSKWVEKMLEVFWRYPDTGIVGPLSNSATYQNIPHLHDFETGNWMKNILPEGFSVEMMGYTIEINSERKYPVVPVLNGFCTMIKREVIDTIGILDEIQFPIGYGEEVDYCLRARNAGFTLRVADDTYIFHEKSKSFGNANKKELSKNVAPYLSATYGDMYRSIGKDSEKNEVLMKARNSYNENVSRTVKAIGKVAGKKIGFVLLTRGGNGGANSVCQEVIGMRKLGVDAYVVNTSNYMNDFSNNYPELKKYTYYYKKGSTEDLYEKTKDFDILIATIFTSVAVIRDVIKMNPRIKPAYYIQDYETLFFEKEDIMYKEAYDSYTLIPGNCLFAKTNWLVKTVSDNHNVKVHKVTPSIDIRVYNPYVIQSKDGGERLIIAAMVRPRTPRRNPKGTLNVLKTVKEQFKERVDIVIFGCSEGELEPFNELLDNLEYTNLGILKKGEVAQLLARSDIFIDMSYYQAFGRTGLEGMCYGCIPVLPVEGGADEYAVNNVNAIVVDTRNDAAVAAAVASVIKEEGKIAAMQQEAIATARRYCVLPASWSELKVLNTLYK